jgi:hypothetical protein
MKPVSKVDSRRKVASGAPGLREVVFVLDQGFGALRRSEKDEIVGVDPACGVAAVLAELREQRVRLCVVLPGRSSPRERELLERILPVDVVADGEPETLARAPALVVSADRTVRQRALLAGHRAAPHPFFAPHLLAGKPVAFLVLEGSRAAMQRLPELLPYRASRHRGERLRLHAAGTEACIAEAIRRGVAVRRLSIDLAAKDPVLFRLDERGPATIDRLAHLEVLESDGTEALLALDATQANHDVGLRGRHGHTLALVPSPRLLSVASAPGDGERRARFAMGLWPPELARYQRKPLAHLPYALACPGTAESFQADVDRYRGAAPLDAAGPIVSRHVVHPDNARVVKALVADLEGMGYCVHTPEFQHAGRTLHNVVADLPGEGQTEFQSLLRDLLEKAGWAPRDDWEELLAGAFGRQWVEQLLRALGRGRLSRADLEELALLTPGYPWWRWRGCPPLAPGTELVLVGCHLDSTASNAFPYNPAVDPAPGADDDATGIAATLAIARMLIQEPRPVHTVRFCFFNAEEQGLFGSQQQANFLKEIGATVRAAICLDMLGYNADPARIFEIHAGYTDESVRDASVPIADLIVGYSGLLNLVGKGLLPQLYQGTLAIFDSPDLLAYDPGIDRSDHSSFHQQGYPAVLVCEDFFLNPMAKPVDVNPNYHTPGDQVIDAAYAASITCAVSMAVRELAQGG